MKRRTVIKAGLTISGGLMINFGWSGPASAAGDTGSKSVLAGENANSYFPIGWLEITPDNQFRFTLDKSEMGQGVSASLPVILAEELEVAPEKLEIVFPSLNSPMINPNYVPTASTGASNSVETNWHLLRKAGAAVRELMRLAAAEYWQTTLHDCSAYDGQIKQLSTGKTVVYGDLITIAGHMPLPDAKLKSSQDFRYIGRDYPIHGISEKVTGRYAYDMDRTVAGMLSAIVIRYPAQGGSLDPQSAKEALALPGIEHILEISSGVAVVGSHYWALQKARPLIAIESPAAPELNTEGIFNRLAQQIDNGLTVKDTGGVDSVIKGAAQHVEAEYRVPYLAHASLEPLSCIASVTDDSCEVWAATQMPPAAIKLIQKTTGLALDKIQLHLGPMGGSFGRRRSNDYIREAVEISQQLRRPVKSIWSREDDIRHDCYRTAAVCQMQGALNQSGKLMAWRHRVAVPTATPDDSRKRSTYKKAFSYYKDRLRNYIKFGEIRKINAMLGASKIPYRVDNIDMSAAFTNEIVRTGSWRSIAHSYNAFFVESFIDELAHKAGKDPYRFRRDLMTDEPTMQKVLDIAMRNSGWVDYSKPGRALGIAVHKTFNTAVAQVAEVSLERNQIKVHRIVCAIDCGTVINPQGVRAQVEGSIIFGLSAALQNEITIDNGAVQQSNYHDFPVLRMNEIPEIEISIVPSSDNPIGVGEPATPPVAPAVANALFALTGKRLRTLPLRIG